MFRSRLSALAALLALTAARPATAAAPVFDHANFDTTVSPCRDFDQFANGGWKSRTVMPPAYSVYGAFTQLSDRNQDVLYRLLESARTDKAAKPGSDRERLGTYYGTCMDSAAAEQAGAKPIASLLAAVDGMTGVKDVGRQVAWLHANGVGGLFGFFAGQDPKNSDEVIAFASQGGLGLPDRDYYTRQDSAAKATRAAYVTEITHLMQLAGEDAAAAARHADAVLAFETSLANASMTNVQRRDPNATYHKMALDSLVALVPSFGWGEYFEGRRQRPAVVNVTQPEFFRAVNGLLATAPLDTWKAYLRWKVIADAAPLLSTPYVKEWFAFRQKITGAKEMLPRWKRCLQATDGDLGEILGQAYVKEQFTPADKARMLAMVKNLEAALGDRIRAADWMSDSTERQAIGKLSAFAEKIGYPDTWRDYSSVIVRPGDHYANRQEARAYESARNMRKIGNPVERGEWGMTPPTVNAFYSSSLNSINFPAGILQPPFFDKQADDAVNYGAIGAVIGHEMTHGFDDRGRQFDAKGNLTDWWTAQDAANYKARADKVADQFSSYTVVDTGVHVNGRLTLGENIADLGGLAVAYNAMQKAYAGKPDPKLDGFTREQRFFLGWARVWRELHTDESQRTLVQTDPHAPAHWRINGPLSNLKEFQDAWGCKDGDPMVAPAEKRSRICERDAQCLVGSGFFRDHSTVRRSPSSNDTVGFQPSTRAAREASR